MKVDENTNHKINQDTKPFAELTFQNTTVCALRQIYLKHHDSFGKIPKIKTHDHIANKFANKVKTKHEKTDNLLRKCTLKAFVSSYSK